MLEVLFREHTLITGISLATPLLLCALGGALCSKAGNFNIALEGFMLIGAFFGVVGSFYLHSAFLGILLAALAAMLFGLLYGVFRAFFKAHEIILGFGFNMLAIALTGWLLTPVFGGRGSFYDPNTPTLVKLSLPLIRDIPVLRVLSGHNAIVYFSWCMVPVLYLMLYRTPFGYKIRALGENPQALISAGLSPNKYYFLVQALASALCGIAGAFLSIGNLSMFTENMTAGRGFIAVAAVGFSGAYLPMTALASILFGLANGAAIQLQGIGFPTQLIDMIPYALTIVMLIPYALRQRKLLA